jgi:predicted glutamine amidotransferase
MCRIYGFRANEETKVECTLVRAQNALMLQSRADLRGISHVDGWGIGFYPNGLPSVEKRATPAHSDLHFSVTAERVFSRTVVAHVRRATVGGPRLENTHPFTYGPWLFAHNGTIMGFQEVAPRMEAEIGESLMRYRLGTTDSELAFFWLLRRLEQSGIPLDRPCLDIGAMVRVVAESVRVLAGWSEATGAESPPKLNFLLTDGVSMVASRWNNPLGWVTRESILDCEVCGIAHVHHTPGVDYHAVLITSEQIAQEKREEVPEYHVIAVDAGIRASLYPI